MSAAETLGPPRWAAVTDWFRDHASQQAGKRVLVALGSIVAAGAMVLGLLHTDLFAVERIDVAGNSRISRETVIQKSGIKVTMPMVSIDEGEIRKKLMADPWVENASVATNWPHKVSVTITERKPLLQAQTKNNKWAELGAGGVVLSVNDNPTNGMPVALNTTVEPRAGASLDAQSKVLADVSAALPDSLRSQTKQLLKDDGGIKLGLASDVIVIVGSTDDLASKLTSAAAILRTADVKTIETLDVTSPSMPVTTPKAKPVPTTVPAKSSTSTTVTTTKTSKTTVKPKPQVSING